MELRGFMPVSKAGPALCRMEIRVSRPENACWSQDLSTQIGGLGLLSKYM